MQTLNKNFKNKYIKDINAHQNLLKLKKHPETMEILN